MNEVVNIVFIELFIHVEFYIVFYIHSDIPTCVGLHRD